MGERRPPVLSKQEPGQSRLDARVTEDAGPIFADGRDESLARLRQRMKDPNFLESLHAQVAEVEARAATTRVMTKDEFLEEFSD